MNSSYDLVFLTIGGNDLNFDKVVEKCLIAWTPLDANKDCHEELQRDKSLINQELQDTIKERLLDIAGQLHAGARIVYVGYPSLVRSDPDSLLRCLEYPSCTDRARDIYAAGFDLSRIQRAAVDEANDRLMSDPELSPKEIQVVPALLDVQQKFAHREPIPTMEADNSGLMWDPIRPNPLSTSTTLGLPPEIPYFSNLPACKAGWWRGDENFNTCLSAYKTGYYHPTSEGYGIEARMLDELAGVDHLFGATIANANAVVVDGVSGIVGEVVTLVATDSLPGPKTYSWDFDGDGSYDDTTVVPTVQHRYLSTLSGSVRVRVAYSGGYEYGSGPIDIRFDGDSVDGDDNCPDVANDDQSDSDADGQGDACDATPTSNGVVGTGGFGEPHMVTLDGLSYDFQAVGEFHLARIPARNLDIQVRYVPYLGFASVLGGVAFEASGRRVNIDSDLRVSVEGVDVPDDLLLLDGTRIVHSPGKLDVHFRGGVWLQVTPSGVGVKVAPGLATKGLLGNNDGSRENDVATSSGERVSLYDARRIHERYADSWRITDSESAFVYADGKSTADFTDRSYPETVQTLADFPAADLEVASAKCQSHGFPRGARLDDCAFDLLVTHDEDAAVQAAVNEGVSVDPTAARFDADGVLTQDFNGSVASTFTHPNYVAIGSEDEAAGPITSSSPYEAAVAGVPRHDAASTSFDLVVKGDSLGSQSEVSLGLDGHAAVVVSVGDDPHVVSGPTGATVTANGSGVTPGGEAYRKYRVVFASEHFGSAMRIRVVPSDLAAGQVLAIDNVRIALVTQPAQAFAVSLPFTTDQVNLSGGSGNLETPGAEDDYLIPISGAPGDDSIFFETGCQSALVYELRGPDGLVVPTSDGLCVHRLYEGLAAGTYTLSVTGTGTPMTYSTQVTRRPPPEVFSYAVGDRVEPGKVAGVDVAGAGNLETTASKDVYQFSLAEPQTVVFDGAGWPLIPSALVKVSTGEVLGNINNHHEYELAAGDYRIDVANTGDIGGYSFVSFVKPAAQVFDVSVGDRVEPGKIAGVDVAGAGSLETTGSKDVYQFSLAEPQTVVFDGAGWPLIPSALVKVSTGEVLGNINNHHEYELAAGDYRIEVANSSDIGGYSFSSYVQLAEGSIRSKWESIGGPGSGLGLPISAPQCDGSLCWQDFQGGQVMSAGGSAWTTKDGIRAAWVASGAGSGVLGAPVRDLGCGLKDGACYQEFEHGSVYWMADSSVRTVLKPIRDTWGANGGEGNWLGYPTNDQQCDVASGVCWQDFQGGQVMSSGGSAWTTSAAIRAYWMTAGGPSGDLGAPVGGLESYGSGLGQGFAGGSVFWSEGTGAHAVLGPIRNGYGQLGWFNGFGYPTEEQHCQDGVCWQKFGSGELMSVGTWVSTTSDEIRTYWLSHGGPGGGLGMPASGWIGLRDGGSAQIFQNGTVYSTADGVFAVYPPVRDVWGGNGYETGWMGYPTSDSTCDADTGVCWQKFEHGQIMSANGGAWTTSTEIRTYWVNHGGPSGDLGMPTSGWIGLRDGGSAQIFQNGTVYATADGVFAVYPPVRDVWGGNGYETGWMGYPTSDSTCEDGVCWQKFEHGQIMTSAGGAWTTSNGIRSYWLSHGGPGGDLGMPSSGWISLRDGGSAQIFQNGTVYSTADGVFAVYPPIRDAWGANGYETGWMGYPTSDSTCDADKGVCWQKFEHGQLAKTAAGVWTTTDAIRVRWLAVGGSTGSLGNPTGGFETYTDGKSQSFEHGSIFWSEATGAHAVRTPIRTAYLRAGGQSGDLGYPTAEQECQDDVCWQNFEHGQIVAVDDEAWVTSDAVRVRWLALGGSTSDLGNPSGDLVAYSDGTSQAFEHGSMFWSDAAGAHAVVAPVLGVYVSADSNAGSYGYPTAEMSCTETACQQEFGGGTISAAK